MKRTAAIVSVLAALAIVGVVLAVTSRSIQAAAPQAPHASALRISQAYGGGGNAGSLYRRDFIEIFNSSETAVDITGWTVQYASATGTAWQSTSLSGILGPGQYYLIAEAQGTGGTLDLPTPDVTGTIAMGATGFKVALVNTTTLLNGACPLPSVVIVDFLGASATASCYEGAAPAPAPSNTASVLRLGDGCQDTDINASDMITVTPPMPRNTASPTHSCASPSFEADLDVSKTGPATALAGEAITYTLSLSNTGNYTATGTLVTDTLPSEVTFVTAVPLPSAQPVSGTLVWDLGDVAPAASTSIEVQVFVSPLLVNGDSFTNTVAATTSYTETSLANNADAVTTFIGAPDLAIDKTGPASVDAGDLFTYTLVYSNIGSLDADGVQIVDQLPAGVTFVTETTASAQYANGTLTWTLGTLAASASGSIDVEVTANKAGDWVNTTTISGGPVDSDPLNNTASLTTTINGVDPYVSKTGPAVVFGGELISYTITYGNSGNVTATATLTDQLPVGFTTADIAFDNSGLPFAGGVWSPFDIAPHSEVSFTLALTVPTTISSATRITNTLTISAVEAGDDPANNTASASSTVYQIVPIATARAGALGEVFAVEGSVTYVPGTYNASGWALQDASGGIAVFYNPPPSVQLYDRVRLVAARGNNRGEEQLGVPVYYFQNLGSGPAVTPLTFTTGQIASGSTEGWLSVITGTISGLGACSGNYQFNVDDGSGAAVVFVDLDTTINICAQGAVNGGPISVIGYSTEFTNTVPPTITYEVKPRFPADVTLLHQVTFVYNDLENVVGVGEDVQLRGDFTNWGTNPITLSHDAGYTVFSATVTLPTTATQNYKYYAAAFDGTNLAWDLLNTNNRSFAPTLNVETKQDYRAAAIGWGNLNGPASAVINLGSSVVVSGQVYVQSVTEGAGAGRGVKAELGYGASANPASWTWSPMTYQTEAGNNDVYGGALMPTAGGVYSYAVRYDANFGAGNPNAGWTYADLDGVPFTLDQAGVVTVTAPQLAIIKGVAKPASEMQLGEVVTYTIELNNSGDGTATGVLITDVLPAEVTFGGFVQQNGAVYAGGAVTWSGSVNAGVTVTVIFTATVGDQRAFYGRTVTNTAQFTSANGGADSAEATFQIVRRYFLFAPIVRH